jgi:hypothetical protein
MTTNESGQDEQLQINGIIVQGVAQATTSAGLHEPMEEVCYQDCR